MGAVLTDERRRATATVLAAIGLGPPNGSELGDVVSPAWRSPVMLAAAQAMATHLAADRTAGEPIATAAGGAEVALERADRPVAHLRVRFEPGGSPRVAGFGVVSSLPGALVVRELRPTDAGAMATLEARCPVQRDTGEEVLIEHAGTELSRHRLIPDEIALGVFDGDELLAVQATVVRSVPVGGAERVIAFNHGSRTAPAARGGGLVVHLIGLLYERLFPEIDAPVSLVDPANPAGLALGGGAAWPVGVHRLLLPVDRLVAERAGTTPAASLDLARAAAILDRTHGGNALHRPASAASLRDRLTQAPDVYGEADVRCLGDAVLGVWSSGFEARTYSSASSRETLRVAPVFDVGCSGAGGRDDLRALLADAAERLRPGGVTHLAVFVPDGDERLAWLAALSDRRDPYVVGTLLVDGIVVPGEPPHIDPILF